MQNNEVKAFRQRLVRAGFTDICIFDCYNGLYQVYCTFPDGKRINKKMSIEEICNTPRVVWFD